ncbi:YbjN domain-containing protein [Corynebacterium sp.]|uniref:YbjN domain-containing protein n=1 Tax=Corynebacterium sp. TaxID=1720 RepID=UPI0026DCE671|nr:YbjN domain-containing protein [Corynebacterium sp.]MDO5077524.1 YbjN domain-containing protein [Corynebacterium sp.]
MISAVTLDRVRSTMQEFDIELAPHEEVATANLNGFPVTFAVLNTAVLIVRADHSLEEPVADGNPATFLACNHFNAFNFQCKAVVMDRLENLVVRTECELMVAAGMTDDQLRAALKEAVDNVLQAQEAITQLVDSMS